MSWKDSFTYIFGAESAIEYPVGGQPFKFYPVSFGLLFKLKAVGKGIMQCLQILFARNENDVTRKTESYVAPSHNDTGEKVEANAISLDLAKHRDTQKSQAMGDLMDTLLDPKNKLLTSEIIMDSMREVFPRDYTEKDIKEFSDLLSAPAVFESICGVLKACKRATRPLAEAMPGKLGTAMLKLLDSDRNEKDPSTSLTTENTGKTTAGSSSPSLSSVSPAMS